MKYKYINGAVIALLDIFTLGIFLLIYMRKLQVELERITGKKYLPYYKAYLLGIPTLFIYTMYWISKVSKDLNNKAKELNIKGHLITFNEMFYLNLFGMWIIIGALIATYHFFDTLNKIEIALEQKKHIGSRLF